MSRAACVLLLVLLMFAPARPLRAANVAADAPPPALPLPSEDVVLRAIVSLPEVRYAEAAAEAARARGDKRVIGSAEAQLTFIPQQRRIDSGPRYREWELDLTKSVRWPGKVALDRRIGALEAETGQLGVEDAHHQGARLLLAQWMAWLRAGTQARIAAEQVELLERDRAVIDRRVALGDAAVKDRLAADAALGEARALALESALADAAARRDLGATFPSLPLPQRAPVAIAPPALPGAPAAWVERIVARSHEIGIARRNAERAAAEAARARADRVPDPVLGIRLLSDLGGGEKVYGVVLGLPLGVRYRGAEAAEKGAQADATRAQALQIEREVRLQAAQQVSRAEALQAVWRQRAAALVAARASAAKIERAYALGEAGIAEVLLARQARQTAALAAGRAAVDALEAIERVTVDAHERWHRHDDTMPAPDDVQSTAPALKLPALGE